MVFAHSVVSRVTVELQEVASERGVDTCKVLPLQFPQKLSVSSIAVRGFARPCRPPRVQVHIRRVEASALDLSKFRFVVLNRRVQTVSEQFLCFQSGAVELNDVEGSKLGNKPEEERLNIITHSRLRILVPPALVALPRQVVELRVLVARRQPLELFSPQRPGDFGHLRDGSAGQLTVTEERHSNDQDLVLQLQAIGLFEGPLKKWFGNFEADPLVIRLRCGMVGDNFQGVEPKLREGVSPGAFLPGDPVPILLVQSGVENPDRAVDSDGMPLNIGNVVGERSQSKSILVDITGLLDERLNEGAAPDVVRKVTEKAAAEGIIAHVLNYASTVRVGLCLAQLLWGCAGKALEQKGLNVLCPFGIDNGLVSQDRVPKALMRQEQEKKARD